MIQEKWTSRRLKSEVEALLHSDHFYLRLSVWSQFPARKVINPLISFLCSTHEVLKWRAVTAIGFVVSGLAGEDLESARVIMRRFIWNLNDESGGIAWGAPEAMGEIMASHGQLAEEFTHILVSYIRPDGNPLEYELLERGVLWGLGRLALVRSHLLLDAVPYMIPYLEAKDSVLRGLAAWGMGLLKADSANALVNALTTDRSPMTIYLHGELRHCRVCDLALEAIGRMNP